MNPNATLSPYPATNNVANFGEHIYENIMELLVKREIQRQMQKLSPQSIRFVDPVDVATYALNRLPPLYASTEKGREYQEEVGTTHLRQQISAKVCQAIAAVQRDPIRKRIPIKALQDSQYQHAQEALSQVEALLAKYHLAHEQPLTWENLPQQIKRAIRRIVKPQIRSLLKLEKLLNKYNILNDCKVTQRNFVDIIQIILEQVYEASQQTSLQEEE
jgi:hypothetical protein